jgi:drug/metabolite transporter (DMT)-like permease
MSSTHIGEFAALLTALCWMLSSIQFEIASKQVGSVVVNLLRLCLAFVFLSVYGLIVRGMPFPLDATPHAWVWLSLSGLAGFVLGDALLFRAYVVIGARVSMVIMATSPLITALIGWLVMGETLTPLALLGMCLTVGGIALVVLERNPEENHVQLSHSPRGLLYAFGGATGQAIGLVLSKYGMGAYDPVAATQVRQIAGIGAMLLIAFVTKNLWRAKPALQQRRTLQPLLIGSFVGPTLGVSLSLFAVQHTSAAIASTLMATTPIMIIPPAIFLFKEKVTLKEGFGALLAVAGVVLLFM